MSACVSTVYVGVHVYNVCVYMCASTCAYAYVHVYTGVRACGYLYMCVCVCVHFDCTFSSFVKSRHFWLWTKTVFAELCGEKISEADSTALEEGLDITRDFMRTYVKSSLHPISL